MHHLQSKDIRDKIKQTNLIKYGFENPGSNLDVNNKRKETNLIKYGFENPMQNPNIARKSAINRIAASRYVFPENLKNKSITSWNQQSNKNPVKFTSYIDKEKIDVNSNECTMMMIYKRTASIFMNKYHQYGWDNRGKLCMGWVYENMLIELMTFGKAKNIDYEYQIYQVCTHPKYHIQNGLYEIYKYVTKYFEISNVIFYEDVNSSEYIGNKLKLKVHSMLPPMKLWYRGNIMIPDDQISRRDLLKLFKRTSEDIDKESLMTSNGWISTYNHGFLIFTSV